MADLNQRLQILLTEEQMNFVKNLSRETGKSTGELIRTALDQTFRPEDPFIDRIRLLQRIAKEDFLGDRTDGEGGQ